MDEQVTALIRRQRLDPYSSLNPRLLGVVDTNALFSSIENDHRKGLQARSRLLRMTDGGTTVLYAADHVYSEVYERLPRFADRRKLPLDDLRERFEQRYLPVLRFVEVAETEIVDPQVLAITDPDDVPTGQLAKLIGPCIVFSEDKHLKKPGFAPTEWRAVAKFAVDLAEGADKQNTTGQLAVLPGLGLVEVIKFVSRRTGMSPWVLTSMVAAASILLLKNPERRKAVGERVVPVVEALGQIMIKGMQQEQLGVTRLREVILPAPEEPSVKQQVAIVLAREPRDLLAREIQNRIAHSFDGSLVPTIAEVRATLAGGSEFVRSDRYRWQFGRRATPWKGAI